MPLHSNIRWIGVLLVSIISGILVGGWVWQFRDLILPPFNGDSTEYSQWQMRVYVLEWIFGIWGGLVCFGVLGLNARIRYHILFFHSLAMLGLGIYTAGCVQSLLQFDIGEITNTGLANRTSETIQLFLLLLYLTVTSILLFAFALIAAQDDDANQRSLARKMRISISDGHRPPLH